MDNPKEFPRFPIFISLDGKKVVVIGGGPIAERRIKVLLRYGAQIHLISPEISKGLKELAMEKIIIYEKREYHSGDLQDAELVISATNHRSVNQAIGIEAEKLGVYSSIADKKEESTFYFPGTVLEGNLVAGVVSTNGDHKGVKEAVKQLRSFWKEEQE